MDVTESPWIVVWRHPLPRGGQGRCIGRTDLPVDPRKAKRLAHRIRRDARRRHWPAVVWTSPLRRCADVGRWLARWGWQWHTDARLAEFDFGRWDGQAWTAIGAEAVDAWCADFADHAPGEGESVQQLMGRCAAFLADVGGAGRASVLVVGHAGWINAARWCDAGVQPPLDAAQWPAPLRHGASLRWALTPLGRPGPTGPVRGSG